MKKIISNGLAVVSTLGILVGCGGSTPSISVQPSTEAFSQGDAFNIKVDILWVVDPSRSMFEETENVKANISNFMKDIVESKYDYRMGVVSTAAWSDLAYQADPASKSFLQHNGSSAFNRLHRGECVNYTESLSNTPFLSFLTESDLNDFLGKFDSYFDIYGTKLGTSGCGLVGPPFSDFGSVAENVFSDANGFDNNERSLLWEYVSDERPLQSARTFLESSESSNFLREDAFLAVVLVTDEPDASRDSLTPTLTFNPLTESGGHSASTYLNFLNDLKNGSENYAVYSIINTDGSNPLDENVAIGSGGQVVNINGTSEDYANNLSSIKNSILQESSLFSLSTVPVEDTLQVTIITESGEKKSVPKDTGSGGFIYVESLNAIKFAPPFVPKNGENVSVNFDKTSLGGGGGASSLPFIALSNNTVDENTANETTVGQLSIENFETTETITYTLNSDTSNGGFSVSSDGVIKVIDSSLLDREQQALHSLAVTASASGITDIEKDLIIILNDEIDATPVAAADSYIASEGSANNQDQIIVTGNVSFNDAGLDASESHTYTLNNPVNLGTLDINSSTGAFTYTVAQSELGLSSGDQHIETINYTVADSSGNDSSANLVITINGLNESPELILPIADQLQNITSGEVEITLNSLTFSGLASGSSLDFATDNNASTQVETSAAANSAHFIEYGFGGDFFEVNKVILDGGQPMGNTIVQVLSSDDKVLSRKVLNTKEPDSTEAVFSSKVIGNKIKLLRPYGAVTNEGTEGSPDFTQDLKVKEIKARGVQVSIITIDLTNHFEDPDLEALTFYATDVNGEGPAPGWITIQGNELRAIPPAGANADIGVLAVDGLNSSAFTTFNITRTGGSSINTAPIALLNVDDTQRGGITLKRYGGQIAPGGGNKPTDLSVEHAENDDFIDQLLDENGDPIQPTVFDGDVYGTQVENGWDPIPILQENKFAQDGKMIPLVNSDRKYGEIYNGFFIPDRTGIYRFRSNEVDDTVRLLVSTTEYFTDLKPVITGVFKGSSAMYEMMIDSLIYSDPLGVNPPNGPNAPSNEFFPTDIGGGHDTSIFFAGGLPGYSPGYIYLQEGNTYSFQIRFAEGGSQVAFDFEFDFKPESGDPFENDWRPIDAITVIPAEGIDGYTARAIEAQTAVNFDASELFYDAELDVLEYTATLVTAEGDEFIGPNGTSDVSEVGLNFNSSTGSISGVLNSVYDDATDKPRVKFTATEKFTALNQSVSSLSLKFNK